MQGQADLAHVDLTTLKVSPQPAKQQSRVVARLTPT